MVGALDPVPRRIGGNTHTVELFEYFNQAGEYITLFQHISLANTVGTISLVSSLGRCYSRFLIPNK